MSKKREIVVLEAPEFGIGVENAGTYSGHRCGYCQGNGWFWGEDGKDYVKTACPKCGGTGRVKGIVSIEWVPDGELIPDLKQ